MRDRGGSTALILGLTVSLCSAVADAAPRARTLVFGGAGLVGLVPGEAVHACVTSLRGDGATPAPPTVSGSWTLVVTDVEGSIVAASSSSLPAPGHIDCTTIERDAIGGGRTGRLDVLVTLRTVVQTADGAVERTLGRSLGASVERIEAGTGATRGVVGQLQGGAWIGRGAQAFF